jgi:hypothetical protein
MASPFIGVQLGSHSIFDEGVDHVLDVLQQKARINTLLLYNHAYQRFAQNRPAEGLADHGRGVRRHERQAVGHSWVTSHDEHYAGTFLRHERSADEYADRDVLDEVAGPAADRGMQVYARMLEGHEGWIAGYVDNWPKILTVDVYGRRGALPCWNNPDYRTWLVSTVEDVVSHHAIDGYMYGSERSGPLSNLLTRGQTPGCFCTYCQQSGHRRGINVDRAITGFTALDRLAADCRDGKRPPDGYLVAFLRILLHYPEVLRWEYEWHQAKESVARDIYGTVKTINPSVQVGWHVYHAVTWDPIYQAEMDYADMVSYSDWLKPVVYHDIAGVRIRDRFLTPLSRSIFGDLSPATLRTFLFEALGYDPAAEAEFDELPTQGMSPEYVWRQVRRCVVAVDGKIPVYAGVGFDVPTDGNPMRSAPDRVHRSVYRSFEAGAAGLLVSREYDEMRMENLEAVGRGIDDALAAGLIPDAALTVGR